VAGELQCYLGVALVKPRMYYCQGTENIIPYIGGTLLPAISVPGIPFVADFTSGIVGLMEGTQVSQYWDLINVSYPAAIIGYSESVTQGVALVIDQINSNAGPFALGGLSQGAQVMSEVYKEILTGSLVHRSADFLGGFASGNPERQAGHTLPFSNAIDPGGHGIAPLANRLTGSESRWWEFCAVGDLITVAFDDAVGTLGTSIFEFITFTFNGAFVDLEAAVQDEFSTYDPVTVSATLTELITGLLWVFPHLSYRSYKPLTGDSRGCIDIMADELIRLAKAYIPPVIPTPTPPGLWTTGWQRDDRFRFIVEEARSGTIIAKDLEVQKPKLLRALSGACDLQFDVDYRAYANAGIYFKPWAHWIHVEKLINGERKIWASALVAPSEIDKKSGVMHLEAKGFSGYAKGMPWLDNWNPLAVDPFEIVHKIWDHLQSYPDGNLGITVYPATSGLEMLPGYAFDGELLNLDFFAVFIRASDKNDCGDYIDSLARDIPFDYVEQSAWNSDKSGIDKKIYLGYPIAGAQQDHLAFIVNENVIEVSPHIETEIDWASDVIIDGWFPGTEVSAQLTNADPNRYRRVVSEDDARINSDERAAAWARRKLTRRQTPAHFDSIIVDMGHPNAPFGSYDVGDRIWVKGLMPWVGDINQLHKILAIAVDEDAGTCELTLRAEGAYEYDPIYYQGSVSGSLTITVPDMGSVLVSMDAPTIG
jgi:hypothetical protein